MKRYIAGEMEYTVRALETYRKGREYLEGSKASFLAVGDERLIMVMKETKNESVSRHEERCIVGCFRRVIYKSGLCDVKRRGEPTPTNTFPLQPLP